MSPAAPVAGQAIRFTASVKPGVGTGTARGSVQFQLDGLRLGAGVVLDGSGHAVAIFTSGSTASGHRAAIDEMARLLIPGGVVPGDSANNPIGFLGLHSVTGSTVQLRGWAYDPDASSKSVTVEVFDGSRRIYRKTTDVLRTDINTGYNISGNHGFRYAFTAADGDHRYCVQYDTTSWGSGDTRFCFTAKVNGSPTGALENVVAHAGGSVTLTGWTVDPDAAAQALQVDVHRDSSDLGQFTANTPRPDVDTKYNITGGHGYLVQVQQQPTGTHTYCVDALNYGPVAPNTRLGCHSITVP